MKELTPKQTVQQLDRYIVGQDDAKRAVAIAIRNRWRRQQLPEGMREEVGPKNIIMIGPTGVGKTEIARRVANLVSAPFVKVEASKFTEVGYHGRDVESMIRDLLDRSIRMVRDEQTEVVRLEAERRTEERILDALIPTTPYDVDDPDGDSDAAQSRHRSREKLRQKLLDGQMEDQMIEIVAEQKAAQAGMFAAISMDQIDPQMQNFLENLMPSQQKNRRVPIHEARKILFDQECEALIDKEKVHEMAIQRAENSGIVFVDEIDKVCGTDQAHGPDVSRQGVQRDLLPIVEGSSVPTRYGPVKTDHVLFIAAGAFHSSKPSDLMPELQGRFPIRVELTDLTSADFVRILSEPENALTKQYRALLLTEGVELTFLDEGIEAMADLATEVNRNAQNIGARRLHTIIEKLLEEVSFDAPDMKGEKVVIDRDMVQTKLADIAESEDLSRFIL